MKDGADLIYQGVLSDGTWIGKPDFLEKVDRPSRLGSWSYTVVDTKLAREAKGGALLQIMLYAELVAQVQGELPEEVHLELAGPNAHRDTFRVADYAAYFRSIKHRFLEHIAHAPEVLPLAVDPVLHCDICQWSTVCAGERRAADHLSLVAGISRRQRRALHERQVTTVQALAQSTLPFNPPIDRVNKASLSRVHAQASIQVKGRSAGATLHELLQPIAANQGLAALPEPSAGDLLSDLEGDPYAFTHGIEFLFG